MPRKPRKVRKRKRVGYRRRIHRAPKGCTPYRGSGNAKKNRLQRNDNRLSPLNLLEPNERALGFHGFPTAPFEPIRVLSLFDGIGAGLCALDRLGIRVGAYFSSEINTKALSILQYRHHGRITMIGCVKSLDLHKIASLGRIDLLLGGSPCSDLSLVNPNRRGLHGPESTGALFFEYCRILQLLKDAAKASQHPFFWLFENTFAMEKKTQATMTKYLECAPIIRCASSYVPMKRKRYFWGNIPGMYDEVEASAINSSLQSYLMPYRVANVHTLSTLTSSGSSQRSGKEKILPVTEDGQQSHLLITEEEILFGFPEHYTDGPHISITDRRALLGKSWCIPVICDILKPLIKKYELDLSKICQKPSQKAG